MTDTPTAAVETDKDFGPPPGGTVGKWLIEIKAYERSFETWEKRVEAIVKRYRNEATVNQTDGRLVLSSYKTFNILWSNIQTLQPALYSRMPKPDVSRVHKDRNPVARAAAVILERATRGEIRTSGFDNGMRSARDDYLLGSRGQLWVRYVPTYGEEKQDQIFLQDVEPDNPQNDADAGETQDQEPDEADVNEASEPEEPQYAMPDGSPLPDGAKVLQSPDGRPYINDGEPYQPVVAECVEIEHINWRDFGHTPAPKWEKVRAVWKREQLTREQLIDRFGKEKGDAVALTRVLVNIKNEEARDYGDAFKRAEVFEIWDKPSGKVIWISPGYKDGPLDEKDDPLHLEGFFPCPRPLYGTLTTDSLIPVTDYDEYATQAEEIDRITQRIVLLTKAMKVAGVYAADIGDQLQRIIDGNENMMVPVDSWAAFAEKGGLAGMISYLPIKEIAAAIASLNSQRQQAIQDLYQITGLSDIIRGQTDPRETATAQNIKGRFASMRLTERQATVSRFAVEVVKIVAEIIAEHFSEETLWEISGWEHTDEARALDKAEADWLKQAQAYQQAMMAQATATLPMATGQAPMASGISGSSQPMSGPAGSPPTGMPGTSTPPMPQPPQGDKPPNSREAFAAAIALIRDEKLRNFAIDIETDSMVFDDQQQDQQGRVQLVQAVGGYLQQALPAAQMYPAAAPVLLELMMFALRGFKTGRSLEAMFEQLEDELANVKPGAAGPAPAGDGKGGNQALQTAALQVQMSKLQLEMERLGLARQTAESNIAIQGQRLQQSAAAAQRAADTADARLAIDRGRSVVDAYRAVDGNPG